MLTEFFFLQAPKWIDLSLFTASHGWKWRPYYQVPKIWTYSYGNQGLHVENIYDPFQNTAYEAGPLYNSMEWLVDAVGQGPNPQWVRDRQKMQRAFMKADRILHARFSPQMQVRSLKKEQFYLKQFSLTLHAQYIYKYFPILLKDFFQYKVLPPLVEHAPQIFISIESALRRVDYHYANKSLGYHLFIDLLEQLNPPLDDEDRLIPYDYITETGFRMIKQYEDYVFLRDMMGDLQTEVKTYGQLYDDFLSISKEEKFSRMAKGDPLASKFTPPNVNEYCKKFHNYDLATKAKVLIDLKRVCSDYKKHFGPFDMAMAHIHEFLLKHSTPEVYGQYYKKKHIIATTEEFLTKKEAEHFHQRQQLLSSGEKAGQNTIGLGHDGGSGHKYNPLNTLYKDSYLSSELSSKDKLAQMKHEFELVQQEKIFDLDRSNVKDIREFYNNRDAPLHSMDQLPSELNKLHADVLKELLTVLPQSIHDEEFVKPLMEEYYNNRINQHVYKYYPSVLEPEIKQDLDLKYDKSQVEEYFDYIHTRFENRKELKQRREEILAPYRTIKYIQDELLPQYRLNKMNFDYIEMNLQDEPYDMPFEAYPGMITLDTDDPQVRYKEVQQYAYRKMVKDLQEVESLEKTKAMKITNGAASLRRKSELFNRPHGITGWDPMNRIKQNLPPFLSTKFQNRGDPHSSAPLSDYRPENFTKDDIRLFSKVYPGVSFDQVLQVLDDTDSYRPPIINPNTQQNHQNVKTDLMTGRRVHTPPTMDWIGLPRNMFGNDPGRDFYKLQHQDELQRFREDNNALAELYKTHFHSTDDNALDMKHKYILSQDQQALQPYVQ